MKKFRTIEISDSQFEKDNLRMMTVKSSNLKGRGDIVVFVPPKIQRDTPVVILLHGVYGSAWSWPLKTGIHINELNAENPFVLAFPSDGLWGDGSGYLPHDGYNFEKWIAEDVPEILISEIENVSDKSPFFISGLSMGGFGALKIGAKYHQRFKAFSGHSSITHIEQMQLFVEEDMKHFQQTENVDEDVFETIRKYKDRIGPFRFDCGADDLLIDYNKKLHAQLSAEEIAHQYEEFEGRHEWAYWTEHVKKSLDFFRNCL
jgi:S-formylglutathione hydrolase FrmB